MATVWVKRWWMGELIECFNRQATKSEAQNIMNLCESSLFRSSDKGDLVEGMYMIEATDAQDNLWLDPVWFLPEDIRTIMQVFGSLPKYCPQLTDDWATEQVNAMRANLRAYLDRNRKH